MPDGRVLRDALFPDPPTAENLYTVQGRWLTGLSHDNPLTVFLLAAVAIIMIVVTGWRVGVALNVNPGLALAGSAAVSAGLLTLVMRRYPKELRGEIAVSAFVVRRGIEDSFAEQAVRSALVALGRRVKHERRGDGYVKLRLDIPDELMMWNANAEHGFAVMITTVGAKNAEFHRRFKGLVKAALEGDSDP